MTSFVWSLALFIRDDAGAALARLQTLVEDRLVLGEDRIKVLVLGYTPKGNMANGLVLEAAVNAFRVILEIVVLEVSCHQPLTCDGNGNTAGISSDPASAQLFGDIRR